MGEAGPEAVMPLKRGPNGSLGVELYRNPGSSNQPQPAVVELRLRDEMLDARIVQGSVRVVQAAAPSMLNAASAKTRRDAARPITPGGGVG